MVIKLFILLVESACILVIFAAMGVICVLVAGH